MNAQRSPAEVLHRDEILALAATDRDQRPEGWRLSPRSVETFLLGSRGRAIAWDDGGVAKSTVISRKFYGAERLIQRCIVTLASDRGLLLIGEPGTAKSWLSEHLAAAISGNSLLTIQGTAGLTEDQVKYGWNYALLLAEGPTERALVPAPLYTGMKQGRIVRFEEITRSPHEIQDTLLSALSEKLLVVPELPEAQGVVFARRGFNVIATANTRDRGVNEMSSALKRRFNFETVPPIDDLQEEVRLVRERVESLLAGGPGAGTELPDDVLEVLVTTFHEIRAGRTAEGVPLDRGTATMSTAEAVSVGLNSALHASFFGDKRVEPEHVVMQLSGVAVKDNADDRKVLHHYFEAAVKPRAARDEPMWKAWWAVRSRLDG